MNKVPRVKQNTLNLSVLIFVFGGLLILCPLKAASSTHLLAKNIRIEDRVVELELPIKGANFSIIWVTENNKQWGKNHVSRKGVHLYEMRDHPEWKGRAIGIYISKFEKVDWKLKQPATREELGIFLVPREISPSSINALITHTLYGWKWDTVLMIILYGLTAILIARTYLKFADE